MILLTGATGNTGSQVAVQLTQRGVPFKVMARSDASSAKLSALGYQTIRGDFDSPESLKAVLAEGFEKVYLVCTPDEHMKRRELTFIEAAKAAGVRHVVKLSALLSGLDAPTVNLRMHGQVEEALCRSGLSWTIIRPHGFMQTFVLISLDFVKGAGLYLHSAGAGAMALVDVRDVAAVAVKALTEEGHDGNAYDVTGPEALTFYEQATILQQVFRRPVTYVPGREADLRMGMKMMGVAPQSIEHVTIIMRLCRAHQLATVTGTLVSLGIQPTRFVAFVEDLAAGRTGGGNSFQPPDGLIVKAMGKAVIWGYRARFALFGRA